MKELLTEQAAKIAEMTADTMDMMNDDNPIHCFPAYTWFTYEHNGKKYRMKMLVTVED